MQRKRLTMVLVIFAVSAVGLSIAIGTAAGQVKSRTTARKAAVTTPEVTVTAGKPSSLLSSCRRPGRFPLGRSPSR